MFGFSFGEILIIALVALIVVGPERLPRLAQTLGLLMGRAQRYVHDFRADLEKEMRMQDLKEMKEEIHSTVTEFEEGMKANVDSLKKPFNDIRQQSQDLDKKLKQNFDEALSRDTKNEDQQSNSHHVFSPSLQTSSDQPATSPLNTNKSAAAADLAAPIQQPPHTQKPVEAIQRLTADSSVTRPGAPDEVSADDAKRSTQRSEEG